MRLATTICDFWGYTGSIEESIRLMHDAGFRYIDFGMGHDRFFKNDNWKEETIKVRDYAERLGMKFVQAHSPDGDVFNSEKRELYVQKVIRSLEMCKILGIPHTVVHAGFKKGTNKDEFYENNITFYRKLFPYMEETGVNVLTENTTKTNIPPETCYFFYKGEEMIEFIKAVDHPLFHAVWDTGHGNTEGDQYEDIMALGKELYGIHVSDNSERGDEHVIPYLGTLNMDAVMNGLIDSGYKGDFTFEANCSLRLSKSRHGKRHVFERDTRLLEPTLEMQIQMERLMYTIGKHCLTSYGVYEE